MLVVSILEQNLKIKLRKTILKFMKLTKNNILVKTE